MLNELSAPNEVLLYHAWHGLNQLLDKRVPVSLQIRLTACVTDVITFMPLLRQLESEEASRLEKHFDLTVKRWDAPRSFQFAAAFKATCYFLRALQDALYGVLLETAGGRAGGYSSMADAAKDSNPVHALLVQALPDYLEWFLDFRNIRNRMKEGVSTAFTCRITPGPPRVSVDVHRVNDQKREVTTWRSLSLDWIDECVKHSVELARCAERVYSEESAG